MKRASGRAAEGHTHDLTFMSGSPPCEGRAEAGMGARETPGNARFAGSRARRVDPPVFALVDPWWTRARGAPTPAAAPRWPGRGPTPAERRHARRRRRGRPRRPCTLSGLGHPMGTRPGNRHAGPWPAAPPRRRLRLCRAGSGERLKGFEPSTFCMASSRSTAPRIQKCLQIGVSERLDRAHAFQELCADTGGLDNERTMSDADGDRTSNEAAIWSSQSPPCFEPQPASWPLPLRRALAQRFPAHIDAAPRAARP